MGAIVAVLFRTQGPEGLASHKLREADDGVERRAQLMAHIGEEFRLGAVGGLGARFLLMIAFGEVGKLLGLLFERPARLREFRNGDQKLPLEVAEPLLIALPAPKSTEGRRPEHEPDSRGKQEGRDHHRVTPGEEMISTGEANATLVKVPGSTRTAAN